MKYTEATIGRLFILRLEHGDRIPRVVEDFAAQKNIASATVLFLGGADAGSKVVVGPKEGKAAKPVPVVSTLPDASEAIGVGTIFMNEAKVPKLHLHAAFGRADTTITGCTREGVDIWHIGEVVILELTNNAAQRKIDPNTGFELLEV
jgi:predicted DNA-binding protein with PD1-like motif